MLAGELLVDVAGQKAKLKELTPLMSGVMRTWASWYFSGPRRRAAHAAIR